MYKKCRNCGKRFDAVEPGQWVYKIGGIYFCRWNCQRAYERQQEEQRKMRGKKITREQKETAVQLAMEGKDPVAYLTEMGNDGRIAWGRIRLDLKKNFPERYNQLPENLRLNPAGKVQVAEVPEKEQEEEVIGHITIEASPPTLEFIRAASEMDAMEEKKPEIWEPLVYDGMTVTAVRGEFGEYRRIDKDGDTVIDYRGDMKERSRFTMRKEEWSRFIQETDKACRILGVELEMKKAR